MPKHADRFLKLAGAILVIAGVVGAAGCIDGEPAINKDAANPAASGGTAGSGSSSLATGGSGKGSNDTSNGGAGSGSAGEGSGGSGGAGDSATGGRSGAGGGAGGASASQPDARSADVVAGSGGRAGSGGSTRSGGQSGSGGSTQAGGRSGSGGSIPSDGQGGGQTGSGGSSPDAAPDLAAPKDAGSPELVPIPDLPVKADTPPAFWPDGFEPNCTPPAIGGRAQTDGHHRPGENCMTSGCHLNPEEAEHHAGTDCRGSGCHSNGSPDGSGAPAFLFGGTVYRSITLAADRAVEVGIQTTQGFYATCSAANGNFWYIAPSSRTTVTWTGATTRLRNANGEAPMMTTPAAGCNANSCHTGKMKITSP